MKAFQANSWRHFLGGALVAALVGGVAPVWAFAQEGPGPRGPRGHRPFGPPGRGGMMGELGAGLRQLDLSEAQRDQVRSIMQSHEQEFKTIGERMRAAHEKMRAATTADGIDETAIRSASSELAGVQADGAILRARVRQQVWGTVLTPEQQEKAKTLRAEREKRMEERRLRMQERVKQRRAVPPAQ